MTGKSCLCVNGTPVRSRPRPAPSCPRRGTPTPIPAAATPACSTGCSPGLAPAARWPRSAGRNWPACWSSSGDSGPRRPGTATAAPWPPGCPGAPASRLPAPVLPASAERRREHLNATRAVPRPAIDRALSRRDVPLREKTLWRMLYETAARASEMLALNIEDPGLDARRAPIRSKGSDTEWICRGSGTAHLLPRLIPGRHAGPVFLSGRPPGPPPPRSPGPVPGHRMGPARLRPRPDPVHRVHGVGVAPAPPLRGHSPRRARHPAAADHGQDPAPEPAHRDAVRPPRRRSRR